jgi:hypothetical protein
LFAQLAADCEAKMNRKIVTRFEHPPIPTRSFDWCAYYEGEEEAGDYGWGPTEADAIEDFTENCAEDHDARIAKRETRRNFAALHDETMAKLKA